MGKFPPTKIYTLRNLIQNQTKVVDAPSFKLACARLHWNPDHCISERIITSPEGVQIYPALSHKGD